MLPVVFALYPGACAIASTSPVVGSSTIAVPDCAPHFDTVARSTCSAFAWIVWSIVVKTSAPSCTGDELITLIERPVASRTTVCLPEWPASLRSEEHTSELQSPDHLVCRLLLEKKKTR